MKKILLYAGAVVVVLALVAAGYFVYTGLTQKTVVAQFSSTTGLYAGDDVRVLGVTVGRVDEIEPQGDDARVTMTVSSDVDIPADAKAVIIAQSLVSGRFVQLTPVFSGGPAMADGATIPMERTAVPVEWDEIKTELTKLSTALGPDGPDQQGPAGRFIDTLAANLDGNGDALRSTLRELSDTMRVLSDGRTDLFSTIRNLQAFVSALSNSNDQIVQFGGRLASVSEMLAQSSDEFGTAMTDLNVALGEVQRFIADNQAGLVEGVGRLADATQVLTTKRPEIERALHAGPNALANFNNIYQPAQGSLTGAIALNNFGNPINFICGAVAGVENATSERSAALCKQYLGPVLSSLVFSYPALLTNPIMGANAYPDQIVYTEPGLEQAATPAPAPQPSPIAEMPTVQIPSLGDLLGGGR
ncbi:MCE family protein [Rhodococcus sp. PAMC28707]|uniref:MCE family protein n=1 Tax=unclassified Rhodococcus (in: high G+C Gram-positive bacteria) TaxID=192944 RepID=UPI00109E18C3|nr:MULTISPECIES: MCE family protein [unclassified Rhodococcus (in: high G+C Gram-positive bacteria)]QCB50003.1 MCE family protein [Rhodococcus sp. PAMC28705]QCB58302.1 MCE family protein [Rhodococcus sp. PAMC28707]